MEANQGVRIAAVGSLADRDRRYGRFPFHGLPPSAPFAPGAERCLLTSIRRSVTRLRPSASNVDLVEVGELSDGHHLLAFVEDRPVVAALFVYPDGVYAEAPGVDLWDKDRNALLYDGPHSVVAHPPCPHWSIMGQCRGYEPRPEDYETFGHALNCVRRFGGVLEHPAHTKAWKAFDLPRPAGAGWTRALFGDNAWVCEVDQRWYGHLANKPTWLYYAGDLAPEPLRGWGRAPRGEKTVGRSWGQGRDKQRSGTPPAFRDVLLSLARQAAIRIDELPDPEASWALR